MVSVQYSLNVYDHLKVHFLTEDSSPISIGEGQDGDRRKGETIEHGDEMRTVFSYSNSTNFCLGLAEKSNISECFF